MHILPNISKSKSNQIMKFGHLMEYSIWNVMKYNHIQSLVEKFPESFLKKSKLSISLDQQSKVLYSLFLLYARLRTIKIYWNWATYHLLLPYMKLFFQSKSGTSLSVSFSASFFKKKKKFMLYSITRPNFIAWLPLLRERYWAICVL